jgi:hypothetical protein|tara:strand:- start:98 stop:280 length:183 start_codon:yes stop_codon:yes gene_type:complete
MLKYEMEKGSTAVYINPEYVAAVQEKGSKAMIIMGVQGQVYIVNTEASKVVEDVKRWLEI